MLDRARVADEAGFDVLGTIDKPNFDSWDPLVTLAGVGGVKERARLATTILQLPPRNAVLVAKPGGREDEFQALDAELRGAPGPADLGGRSAAQSDGTRRACRAASSSARSLRVDEAAHRDRYCPRTRAAASRRSLGCRDSRCPAVLSHDPDHVLDLPGEHAEIGRRRCTASALVQRLEDDVGLRVRVLFEEHVPQVHRLLLSQGEGDDTAGGLLARRSSPGSSSDSRRRCGRNVPGRRRSRRSRSRKARGPEPLDLARERRKRRTSSVNRPSIDLNSVLATHYQASGTVDALELEAPSASPRPASSPPN